MLYRGSAPAFVTNTICFKPIVKSPLETAIVKVLLHICLMGILLQGLQLACLPIRHLRSNTISQIQVAESIAIYMISWEYVRSSWSNSLLLEDCVLVGLASSPRGGIYQEPLNLLRLFSECL